MMTQQDRGLKNHKRKKKSDTEKGEGFRSFLQYIYYRIERRGHVTQYFECVRVYVYVCI